MDLPRLRSSLLNVAIGAFEAVAPVPAGSRLEEGMLTPREFVAAGDALVYGNPSWKWVSAASGRASSFLPLDKQALLCRGVRSVVRARSLLPPTGSLGGAGTEGFTEVPSDWGAPGPEEVRRTAAPPMTVASLLSSWQFDEDDGGMDVTAFALPVLVSPGLRLYDVSLVYSRFYKTPAFFISGSDGATGEALNPEELLQDVHGDNSGLTATIEPHPQGLFGGRPCISIHPCRHASMMARALAREAQVAPACGSRASAHLAAEDPRLALYLPAFVKLLGSACPSLAGDWIN